MISKKYEQVVKLTQNIYQNYFMPAPMNNRYPDRWERLLRTYLYFCLDSKGEVASRPIDISLSLDLVSWYRASDDGLFVSVHNRIRENLISRKFACAADNKMVVFNPIKESLLPRVDIFYSNANASEQDLKVFDSQLHIFLEKYGPEYFETSDDKLADAYAKAIEKVRWYSDLAYSEHFRFLAAISPAVVNAPAWSDLLRVLIYFCDALQGGFTPEAAKDRTSVKHLAFMIVQLSTSDRLRDDKRWSRWFGYAQALVVMHSLNTFGETGTEACIELMDAAKIIFDKQPIRSELVRFEEAMVTFIHIIAASLR